MKSKHWKHLLTVILIVVLAMALSVGVLADDESDSGGTVEIEGLTASKYITVQEDGTYIIDLDAFSTGEVHTETVNVPADIILVLDVSGSMAETMDTYNYTARNSASYTYNGYGNSQYYYKHTDGSYYPVSRGSYQTGGMFNRTTHYYLYYTANGTTYYLSGTTTTTTRPSNPTNDRTTIWTGVLYNRTTVTGPTKLAALKTAVDSFIDVVAAKNKEAQDAGATADQLSRISIIKFSGNARENNYANYVEGNDTYYYSDRYPNVEYTQVVADLGVVTEGTNATGWKDIVNGLNCQGMTRADYGMGYAKAVVDRHANDHNYTDPEADDYRSRVVVMFTDGLPTSGTSFEGTVANSAISTSRTLKGTGYGVTVYSVAVHPDAHPEQDPGTENFNQYLHGVSSNYPNATAYNSLGTRGDGNYYFAAESADDLDKIFKQIGHNSSSTTSTLSKETVMKDIVSSSFTLPENASEDDITVSIVRWNSTTHAWGTAETGDVYTPDQWKTACLSFGAESAENVAVEISADGKTLDITGFDYATHYKATSAAQDNDSIDVVGGPNKYTAKIVVSFQILAQPSAVTGGSVATNGEASGIYVNGQATEPILSFPVPEVVFTPVTYVVDYVTSDTSHDTKSSTVKLDYTGVLSNVDMLDDPSDDVLKGEKAADFTYTIYKGKYGTISFGDDEVDVQRRYVRYAPTTMNWDDYDRIFVKGPSKTESNLDVWAMLCVIPANSVFYEDTYISQTKTVTYNGEEVEIVYTGINYDSSWDTVGTEGSNQTQHAGDEMGWVTGLADDSDYANDMAHTTSTAKAKATFTFSGTGVDIYSRTNGTTGTVSIKVTGINPETGKKTSKTKLIDTKAAAGDFFAIPVCTFTDLPYGEYTVTITVTTGGQSEGRMTFYLDGVRVYNPIQPHETEENVQMMYGEKNLGAVFEEVRGMLGTGAEATALYIDEHTISEIVDDVDAIQKAAQKLAKAQDDRDAFIEEYITPAKNAISEEEFALSSAEADKNNAKNVYDAAKAVYDAAKAASDADPDNEELAAATADAKDKMDTAEAKMNAANDAYDTAKAHYDATIDGLKAALAALITEKEEVYDAAVDAARAEYDDVNDGVELAITTTDVAVYDKEGPKSEVLLGKGQQVAINVTAGKYYYIGLRSLNGDEVTVTLNGASKTLSHTVDLYYEVIPASNKLVIKNTSEGILSVTKLRTTGAGNTTSGTTIAPTQETLDFVRSLSNMPVTEYTGEILTMEQATEEPAADEPEEEAVPETEILDEEAITIENPEPADENEPIAEEPAPDQEPEPAPEESPMGKILSSFFRFFRKP